MLPDNNAGVTGPTAPVDEMKLDEWEKVVQINLNGTFYVTHFAIPYLKKSPAGVIINMSSVAGRFGYPNRSPYATTKWGLIGFTKTLSIELGEFGIRANAILPGPSRGRASKGPTGSRTGRASIGRFLPSGSRQTTRRCPVKGGLSCVLRAHQTKA